MNHLDRNSLVIRILVLFMVFNLFSIIAVTFYMLQQDHNRVEANIQASISEIAMEKAEVISLTMRHVANETENLAMWASEYASLTEDTVLDSQYRRNKDGVLYRTSYGEIWEASHSCVFFPANVELTEENIKMINATERLEPVFQTMHQRFESYQWSYIATEEGLLRIFPYSEIGMFEPNHQQKGDPFYVVANVSNNPERNTVWTKPYIDYMGTGWMISCSSPLYNDDEFLGVACTDVRIDTLQSLFLEDFRLSETGFVFLLDENGAIIYHPQFMPEGNQQGLLYLENIIENTSISEEYRQALQTMLNDDGIGMTSYSEALGTGGQKLIAYAPIESQDWKLAIEIDYDNYLARSKLQPSSLFVYIIIVIFMLTIFSAFLYRQYSRPITVLTKQAQQLAKGDFGTIESPSHFTELRTLSEAFNTMSGEIEKYTGNLIQKNTEIESIFNSIGGLLMIVSPGFKILTLNESGKSALLNAERKTIGEHCYSAFLGNNEPCKGCNLRKAVNGKKPAYSRLAMKDEVISNSYYPILNENNEVVEIVVYSQRITKSVLMEKELLQTEKLAGIGQISSAIAHELKTPLAIIKGATYLLNAYTEEDDNPKVKETIQTISTTVEEAEKTVYNLLDYTGPGKEEREWIDIGKVINQILFLSNKERIQKNIRTELSLSPMTLMYYGQIEPLKNILQNIISNAVKALEGEGKLSISAYYVENETKLIIDITDDGPGITNVVMEKLFKPFFTTDKTGTGTGLGLWITKMMVDRMDGSICVSSDMNETVFSVMLPIKWEVMEGK